MSKKRKIIKKEIKKIKDNLVILDDNELSIMRYAEEYPENWKKICKALEIKKEDLKDEFL